jgi:hypothetical protein
MTERPRLQPSDILLVRKSADSAYRLYESWNVVIDDFPLSGIIVVSQHLRRTCDQGGSAILGDCHAFNVFGRGATTKPTGVRLAEIDTDYQYWYVLTTNTVQGWRLVMTGAVSGLVNRRACHTR